MFETMLSKNKLSILNYVRVRSSFLLILLLTGCGGQSSSSPMVDPPANKVDAPMPTSVPQPTAPMVSMPPSLPPPPPPNASMSEPQPTTPMLEPQPYDPTPEATVEPSSPENESPEESPPAANDAPPADNNAPR